MARLRMRFVMVGILLAGLAVVTAGWYWNHVRETGNAEEVPHAASRELPRPAPSEFVGSDACADCHDEIHSHYSRHPMALTFTALPDETEKDKPDTASFDPGGHCRYRVERTAEGWNHTEEVHAPDGSLLAQQTVAIEYAIGSGTRGRSYVLRRGDRLSQSPISWFTSTRKFDLSPGYEPDPSLRFRRTIGDGCLSCHAGRASDLPGTDQRFGTPIVLEAAIGCERCHGPGRKHVEAREVADPPANAPDPTIVNPKRLSIEQQEALCYQCHLASSLRIARYGCNDWSFQPGQRLEEVFTTFLDLEKTLSKPRKVVSHVSQMLASRCYVESGKKLQCGTCHDAHAMPDEKTKGAWYRSRCLTCHTTQSCSIEEPVRRTRVANDDCTACHMAKLTEQDVAHVAQTDHRILRAADQEIAIPPWRTDYGLTFFNDCDKGLPDWELQRALGLALAAKQRREFDPEMARTAAELLRKVLPYVPDDSSLLGALSDVETRLKQTEAALTHARRGLELSPDNEYLLGSMVSALFSVGMYHQAIPYCDHLIELDPANASVHLTKAMLLKGLDRVEEGLRAGERAVEVNPRYLEARQWLAQAYTQAGRPSDAARHIEFLRRYMGR